jgi:outer membrane protein TolC
LLSLLLAGGCASHRPTDTEPQRPDVAPATQPASAEALRLDASQIEPMYTEMLAIDLPSVVRVAVARNFDIRQARQAVTASRGELESAVGAAFPALVPTAMFEHVDGTLRATEGNLVGVGFNTFQPSIAIQWVINPGRVIYDIVAAKKRLSASEHQRRAVVLETLRASVVQYYGLVLAQARVSAAHQAVSEAEELLRINRLRTRTGTGVPADELRAEARVAQRRQDLLLAMQEFYNASVDLAVTLHLDSSVTLVPSIDQLPPTHLVREDLSIDELLGFAVIFRPDLKRVRTLVEAAAADQGSTWWGAFGPQFQAAYQYGGITGHANNVGSAEGIPGNLIVNPVSPSGSFAGNSVANGLIKEGILRGSRRLDRRDDKTFGFSDQQRFNSSAGWRLSLSAFGDLKTADAVQMQARIEAERRLDQVRAQVVTAAQASKTNDELARLAQQQVAAAAEALRLSEANLRAGAMTTLDVLQAQDAVTQARLRHAEAVVRYNQSQVNLLAAIGLLDEASLSPQQVVE